MCELCLLNTHDETLNRMLMLTAGNIGSTVHSDGWGITDGTKDWKCSIPMFLTANAGSVIKRELPKTGKSATMLHIRRASPRVPVVDRNSHPFVAEDWKFMHNGKLTPKVEKDFVMEEDYPDIDDKTGKQREKDGQPLFKKVNRSDSLIFFEEFLKDWNARTPSDSVVNDFVDIVNVTMDKFKGKFAFMMALGKEMFVLRGKTAKLFISYLYETEDKTEKGKVIGYVVNTSDETIYHALGLISSIRELEGQEKLHFSFPALLPEETIFHVGKLDLNKVGEIKENPEYTAPVYAGRNSEWHGGASNFTGAGAKANGQNTQNTGPTSSTKSSMENHREKLEKEIFNFLIEYSLSPADLQNLFLALYDVSLQQVELPILHNFATKIIPNICSHLVKKDMKKEMKKAANGIPVGWYHYNQQTPYPWIFIPKNQQEAFIKKIFGE